MAAISKTKMKHTLRKPQTAAFATLVGTIIGAGIFGIPFAMNQTGIINGLILLVLLALTTTLIHLMLGEIALRTKTNYRLAGYAGHYLGLPWKILASSSSISLLGMPWRPSRRTSTDHMLDTPSRSLENAIIRPFGDQEGLWSKTRPKVR